jgi:hypothetical protein
VDVRRVGELLAGLLVGVGGYVHFKIWQNEYRHAPVRELFIAAWVASAVVAVALLAISLARRPSSAGERAVLVAGMALSLGSLAAFALSRGPGLPTLHGTFKEHGLETTASYLFSLGSAKTILATESVAALLCGGLVVRRVRT